MNREYLDDIVRDRNPAVIPVVKPYLRKGACDARILAQPDRSDIRHGIQRRCPKDLSRITTQRFFHMELRKVNVVIVGVSSKLEIRTFCGPHDTIFIGLSWSRASGYLIMRPVPKRDPSSSPSSM